MIPFDLTPPVRYQFPKLVGPIAWTMHKRPERWWERLLGIPTGYEKRPVYAPLPRVMGRRW